MLVFRALTSESPGLFPVHLLSGLWTLLVHQHQCSVLSSLYVGYSGPLVASSTLATSSKHTGRSSCWMGSNLLRPLWARLRWSAMPGSVIHSGWILWRSIGCHNIASGLWSSILMILLLCLLGRLLLWWSLCLLLLSPLCLPGLGLVVTASLGKFHGVL